MLENLFKKKPPSLEQQLRDLSKCGVRLAAQATPEALLEEWSHKQFEEDPYSLVMAALGNEERRFASNLWHFDTECIEDHGDYVRIAEQMQRLAGDDLPLVEIEDYIDVESGEAWLSFVLDGVQHRWTCEVEDDWVDPAVLSRFASLPADRRTSRRFTYLDQGGQDCILGCFTNSELNQLQKTTGLNWVWLT